MSLYTKSDRVFKLTPSLSNEQVDYLIAFSKERHCLRNEKYLSLNVKDKLRENIGLPVGKEGLYSVYGAEFLSFAEHMSDDAVIDLNKRANDCPELYCGWVPTKDGNKLYWLEGEISRCLEDWLIFIDKHFFVAWGIDMVECHNH